ncbi:alpha/beta fold hydrolase [Streptomyces sp. NPDC088116]|uniref:alpha/beta fold hydrolase n=1 Tax=Streptomyces sp. NPDC088116 TaxID=3365825 RepID=UPI0038058F16
MYVHDHLGRPLTSARMSVNGTRLHYRAEGEEETVVLLHGAPKASCHWRDVVPHLTPHYTVITPDLRGLGDSDPAAGGFDTVTLAEDIAGRERPFIDHWMSREAHHVDALASDFLDEYVRCCTLPGRLRAMLFIYRATLEDAEVNRAAARAPLPMPVLAVGGTYAVGDDPARQMREVATDVREVLLDTGHHPAQEAPRETAEACLGFFAGDR